MQNDSKDYSIRDMLEVIKSKEVKKSLLISLVGVICAIIGMLFFSGKTQTIIGILGSVITIIGGNRAIQFISRYNVSK